MTEGREGGLTLNYATVISALGAIIAATAWITNSASHTDATGKDLVQFESTVTADIANMRTSVASDFTTVQQQISILPDQRARMDQVERRLTALEDREQVVDQHLIDIETGIAELRASLGLRDQAGSPPNFATQPRPAHR